MEHSKTIERAFKISLALLSFGAIFLFGHALVGQGQTHSRLAVSPRPQVSASDSEYLWYEAENMRGITQTAQHEPQLNPSYLEVPAAKAPGWSISGPGVSAAWSQGGESEWNSVAASADERTAQIWQDL